MSSIEMRQVNIRFTPRDEELLKKLNQVARETDRPLAATVRYLLKQATADIGAIEGTADKARVLSEQEIIRR